MREAEGINFSVGSMAPSDQSGKKRIPIKPDRGLRHNNPTLPDIMRFVEGLSISEHDKEHLKKVVKKIPYGSLSNFRMNYMNYLKRNGS